MNDDAVGFPSAIGLLVIGVLLTWYGDGHQSHTLTTMGIFLLVAGVLCGGVAAHRRRS